VFDEVPRLADYFLGGFGIFDWRNGVDSSHGKSHRKAPQVVGDREDDLTVLTPKRRKMS
jgi:hypothetical protein